MDWKRWSDRHEFRQSIARLQAVYALTTHNNQGSTFGSVFVDVADIRRRQRSNLLEFKQMLYVAATRPSSRLILANI